MKYMVVRRSDGRYLRGGSFWRWTRFRCFGLKVDYPLWLTLFMADVYPGVEYDFSRWAW